MPPRPGLPSLCWPQFKDSAYRLCKYQGLTDHSTSLPRKPRLSHPYHPRKCCGSISPVGHVVEVLCELSQIGALLLILLFGPKQNFRNLCGNITDSTAVSGVPGSGCGALHSSSFQAESQYPPLRGHSVIPLSYRKARHPAVSAARLSRGCGNHARFLVWNRA